MFKIASGLSLPVDAATQTFALLGRRGSGKTSTAVVLAEEFLKAGQPIVWVDPIGVAWGLRSKFKILIAGGEHGDIALDPGGGAAMAEFLVENRVPTILDVGTFGEGALQQSKEMPGTATTQGGKEKIIPNGLLLTRRTADCSIDLSRGRRGNNPKPWTTGIIMPTTLIGIQDWYISCLNRNGFRGARLNGDKARKALIAIGFTFEQARIACIDAFDMWELEKIANEH